MPVNKGDGVTPGHICYTCSRLYNTNPESQDRCPFGNNPSMSVLQFKAGMNGVCNSYKEMEEMTVMNASNNSLIKQAQAMTDTELNVAIYRKLRAMNEKSQKDFIDYWDYLFPKEYAEDMATDYNESKQHGSYRKDTGKKSEKFKDEFRAKKEKETSHRVKFDEK